MHFLEVLLQICLTLWSGITVTEEISSRGLITGNASIGGSFHIDDYYHDTVSIVVNKRLCPNISVYPNSTK